MKKFILKIILISILMVLPYSSFAQKKLVKTVYKGTKGLFRTEAKVLTKEGVEAANKSMLKDAFKSGTEEIGKNYVQKASAKQLVRSAVRKNLLKEIEEKELGSLLRYGMIGAKKEIAHTEKSAVKVLLKKGSYDESYNQGVQKLVKEVSAKEKKMATKLVAEEYSTLLKKYGSHLSKKKYTKLLSEMSNNKALAQLIKENPKLNIMRWEKSQRKTVDLSKIVRTNKGNLPPNYKYAGSTFYANPALNPELEKKLIDNGGKINLNGTIVTREELIKLDKKYPGGVTYGDNGLPDFTKAAKTYPDGTPVIEEIKGGLTKSSKKDRDLATKQLGDKGITWDLGSYTWHHIEGTNKLVLVDWYYHALCKHAGGRAISKI